MSFKKLIILSIIFILLSGCSSAKLNLNTDRKEVTKVLTLAERQDAMNKDLVNSLSGGTIDNPVIIVDPYQNAPLTALIQFELDESEDVSMIVHGRTEEANLYFEFEENKNHILPIIGLLADTTTSVDIIIDDEIYNYQIQANSLPNDIFYPEVTKAADFDMDNELYFTTPSASGHVSAFDINGDLRWVLSSLNFWDVNILSDGKLCLSTDRIINSPYYATGFVIMDLLGHIEAEYGLPGGYHHDIDELPNGNLLVCSDDFKRDTVEDYIVEVDRKTGEIVKHFDLQDVLDTEDGKSLNWTKKDWFHNNSVDYEATNNTLTLSGRHQDAVVVLDYDSGKLKYIIGDNSGWSEEYQKYFLTPYEKYLFTPTEQDFEWQWAQHAATWIDPTHIMIFDNGMNRSKDKDTALKAIDNYSRMVIYEVDEEEMMIKQVYQYGKERGYQYYSPYICDNDYLDENHYLITSGGISYLNGEINNDPGSLTDYDLMHAFISEVKDDELIFELLFETNIYRAEKMDVTDFTLAPFENTTFLGNLGETTYKKTNENKLVKEYGEDVITPEVSNLDIALEYDRITISTTVENSDNLELLLISDDDTRIYPLHVDATPGMCVAMFNPDDSKTSFVIQTISLVGLKGEYKIAYILNDLIYDTNYTISID